MSRKSAIRSINFLRNWNWSEPMNEVTTEKKKQRKKKVLKEMLLALPIYLAIYVGVYLYLSWNGAYRFNQTGQVRYRSIGMATSDIVIWTPQGCWFQYKFKNIKGEYVSRGNELGYLFAPLIMIDRKWFHPTKIWIEPEIPGETYWFPL